MFSSLNMFNIDRITDRICICDETTSKKLKKLKEERITHILVIGPDMKIQFPKRFTYLKLDLRDLKKAPIGKYLHRALTFIDTTIHKSDLNQVLVHCRVGASRSVSVVVCYLMLKWNQEFKEVLGFVKERRS